MSLFEVNTEELNKLANQLKDISGLLRDGDGVPVINRSLGTIRSFFGFNMSTHKGNLSSVYSTMRDLSNDLMKLGTALSAIARYSQDADIQAFSIFANIPMHVITKVNLIGDFDITKGFLNTRNSTADAVTIGLTRNWLDNGIGIIGKGMEIISGGNAKIGKTADEEIMIDSIESLLKSSCDTPNQLMENIESLFKKMSPEEYENFMKVLKTVVSTGKTLTEAEVYDLCKDSSSYSDPELLLYVTKLMSKQDAWEGISDAIDKSFGKLGDAVEYGEFATGIAKTIFTDYTQYVINLEAIRTAMREAGYNNELVDSCIDRMMKDYQNKAITVVNDCTTLIAEKGIDLAMKEATGGLYKLFAGTWSITNTLTGLQDTTDGLATVYATQQYSYALVDKYNECAEKIRSGNYTESDLQQCNMYFELARNAKIQEYTAIKNMHEEALNSASSLFASKDDKNATREYISLLENEISRLKALK